MAVTPSKMIPIGTPAPQFTLMDTITNQTLSLDDLKSNLATVIMFICNHCPFVKHILPKLIEVAHLYEGRGIHFIAINSNDVKEYPEDSPENMKALSNRYQFPFPYLFDETQEVAKAYDAACTPDFYIFDKDLTCVYRGRFDDSTPGNHLPITGKDLCTALDNILANQPINPTQYPSTGCNIKWLQDDIQK